MSHPVVFISSTSDDLKEHRKHAAAAAQASGFSPSMMEYFPASGHAPSLEACLEKVAEAEVVLVLVAHRYGWVPDSSVNADKKSITWLECEYARKVKDREVLAFLVDPQYDWPLNFRENYRLITESSKRGIKGEVRRNEKNLEKFKQELGSHFRSTFTDAASVRPLVSEALAAWRQRSRLSLEPPPSNSISAIDQSEIRKLRKRLIEQRRELENRPRLLAVRAFLRAEQKAEREGLARPDVPLENGDERRKLPAFLEPLSADLLMAPRTPDEAFDAFAEEVLLCHYSNRLWEDESHPYSDDWWSAFKKLARETERRVGHRYPFTNLREKKHSTT